MTLQFDPLKIYYLVILGTDDPRSITPFQGFSTSWASAPWAMHKIAALPADVLERSYKNEEVLAQRMGGLRPLSWAPLSISSLETVTAHQLGVFVVLFTGEANCAERVAQWMKTQKQSVLHVSTQKVENAVEPDAFTIDRLQAFCDATLKEWSQLFDDERRAIAKEALGKWGEPPVTPSGIKEHGHNVTRPNHMTLTRSFRSLEKGEPFIGNTEDEYTAVILESARAVIKVREDTGLRSFHQWTLIRPEIILAEPALVRLNYKRRQLKDESKAVQKTLRWIQTQKGLCTESTEDFVKLLQESPEAKSIIAMRASELNIFTLAIGLRAAQNVSAVVRLSPGVNHVFPSLSAYARNVRSDRIEARLKTPRLFETIQEGLKMAVGSDRLKFIEERGGPIKIISDAPIELLPVGNLPLALRYDCSRLNATPGNLLMSLLLEPAPITVSPDLLHKILVISAFSDDDPLKDILTGGLEATREFWKDHATIVFKRAQTVDEFVAALNEFDGGILIFDGHGADNANETVGKLCIGNELVDVWSLRGKADVPPVVILSACDTHGIDASSHATVGNGFLFMGAHTVLATLLPVGGFASASFIARLVHRIAEFVPTALVARRRVLNWAEVVSGMLRMLLATEILDTLIGPPAGHESPRAKLHLKANTDINMEEDEKWFDNLLQAIADQREQDLATIEMKARSIVARSEAIRYIQLGSPESILIDDGKTRARLAETP